jgi:hypothetical protein
MEFFHSFFVLRLKGEVLLERVYVDWDKKDVDAYLQELRFLGKAAAPTGPLLKLFSFLLSFLF